MVIYRRKLNRNWCKNTTGIACIKSTHFSLFYCLAKGLNHIESVQIFPLTQRLGRILTQKCAYVLRKIIIIKSKAFIVYHHKIIILPLARVSALFIWG